MNSVTPLRPKTATGFPPSPEGLRKVSLTKYKIAGPIQALLSDAVDEDDLDDALPRIYGALTVKGMKKAQVASVIWSSEGVGKLVQADSRGYAWLTEDINRVLDEARRRVVDSNQALFDKYIFVERQGKYWSRVDRELVDIANFELRLINEYGASHDYNAHKYFHMHRAKYANSVVADCTYWPGQPEIVSWNGVSCVNRWRAPAIVFGSGDVSPWLRLAECLITDEKEREHFYDLMAWIVQHPGMKPGHHLLLGGRHGIGKDTVMEAAFYAIGGGLPSEGTEIPADRVNIKHIKSDALEGDFGYFLNNQVLCIQELRAVYVGERKRLGNKMKDYLAAPPHDREVNEKYAHPYSIPNVHVWFATSNYADALPLEKGERRWFAIWSDASPMTPDECEAVWQWYWSGNGVQDVAGWLKRRNVKKFHAHAPAPKTAWYESLVASGMTDTEVAFEKFIEQRMGPFKPELVSPQDAADIINRDIVDTKYNHGGECGEMPKKVIPGQVGTALQHAGWLNLGMVDSKKVQSDGSTRRLRGTLYASPETAEEYKKIRDAKGGRVKLAELYFDGFKGVR